MLLVRLLNLKFLNAWPQYDRNFKFAALKRVPLELTQGSRHCEEQSDEAIQVLFLDCFAFASLWARNDRSIRAESALVTQHLWRLTLDLPPPALLRWAMGRS
jgi:hypothetical protein